MPFFLASTPSLYPRQPISCVSWRRVATCVGTRSLSHPAVRQPRSPDRWHCSSSGADRRALLFFVFRSSGAADLSRAGGRIQPDHGAVSEHHQTGGACQPADCLGLAHRPRATTRWRPAEARLHAPQEDDPLRRRQRTDSLCPHLSSRNPRLPRHRSPQRAGGTRVRRADRSPARSIFFSATS